MHSMNDWKANTRCRYAMGACTSWGLNKCMWRSALGAANTVAVRRELVGILNNSLVPCSNKLKPQDAWPAKTVQRPSGCM